ncbi:MAG TPA: hypothetical protein VFJ30_04745 [Phycisphaerae bacterium]|nr:hypothetical protein [Phycisphaerae bacterium]
MDPPDLDSAPSAELVKHSAAGRWALTAFDPESEIQDRQPALRGGRFRRAIPFLAAGALYLALAGYVAWLTRDRINPDAISHIQAARNYAAGRFDLAVNGWFSPALSWLLVPAAWLGWNPVAMVRVMGVVLGLGFAGGAAVLTRRLVGGRWTLPAFAAALLLIAPHVGDEITPDLLLTCALSWYLVVSIRLLRAPSVRLALPVGLLGGLCFLIKPYALPFVVAHLVVTHAIGAVALYRNRAWGGVARSLSAGVAGALLISIPWITLISIQNGRVMVTSFGRSWYSWGPLPVTGPLPPHRLQRPRPGRINAWENPVEIPYAWPEWRRREGESQFQAHVRAVGLNTARILTALRRVDAAGLLLVGVIATGALAAGRACRAAARRIRGVVGPLNGPRKGCTAPEHADMAAVLRLWAFASLLVYVGGYALVWFVDRLLWPMWGLLLAMSLAAIDSVSRVGGGEEQGQIEKRAAAGRLCARAAPLILGLLLVGSIAAKAIERIDGAGGARVAGARATWVRQTASLLSAGRQVAANHWYSGIYASYWSHAVFLGELPSRRCDAIAAALAPYGPTTVLVFDDPKLAAALARAGAFRAAGGYDDERHGWSVRLLEYRPATVPGADPAR